MLRANGIEYHVEDFEKEVTFFKDVLKCPVVREVPGRLTSFRLADNFVVLVLQRDTAHPAYTNLRGLTVDITVDDVDAKYEELKARGLTPRQTPVMQPSGIKNFYFETPGGLTIEYEHPTTPQAEATLKGIFGGS